MEGWIDDVRSGSRSVRMRTLAPDNCTGRVPCRLALPGRCQQVLFDSGQMLLQWQVFQTNFSQDLPGPRPAWTEYTFTGAAVPIGATAAMVEFTLVQFEQVPCDSKLNEWFATYQIS
jgi:hypothetical protein